MFPLHPKVEKFKLLYSIYCNNYAKCVEQCVGKKNKYYQLFSTFTSSVKVFAKITKDSGTSRLLKVGAIGALFCTTIEPIF